MKHIQKHIIVFSGFAVCILLGYFAFQNFNSSQLDEMKNPLSKSDTGSIQESHTGKSLITPSQSGNQWGGNPFDTRIPFTQEMKDPAFYEPNLKWKTRQVTLKDGRTLTYEFGKGNPREVALDDKGIEKLAADCADMPPSIDIKPTNMRADMLWKNGFCNSENDRPRYLSKQVEYHLLMALSSPDWYDLYKKCEPNIRFGDKYRSDPSLRFDQVFASGFLDINHFIQVDPETGWKQLNMALTNNLLNFILNSQLLIGQGDVITNPYGDCVDQYGFGIKENLGQALYNYSVLP